MARFLLGVHEVHGGNEVRKDLRVDDLLGTYLLLHLLGNGGGGDQRHIAEQLGEPEGIESAHEEGLAEKLVALILLIIFPGHVVDGLDLVVGTRDAAIEKDEWSLVLIDILLHEMMERLDLVVLQTATAVAVVGHYLPPEEDVLAIGVAAAHRIHDTVGCCIQGFNICRLAGEGSLGQLGHTWFRVQHVVARCKHGGC